MSELLGKAAMAGDTFNQNHSGSGDNIINFGRQEVRLTDEFLSGILAQVPASKPVKVICYGNNDMGMALAAFLRNQGRNVIGNTNIHMYVGPKSNTKPLDINSWGEVTIVVLDVT